MHNGNLKVITVKDTTDLDEIKKLMAGILGEICWEARFGYGDELILEIGARISHKIRDHGAYIFGSRGTAWKLISQDGTIIAEDDNQSDYVSDEMRQKIQIIVNTSIMAFEVTYPTLGLILKFSNHFKLAILPTEADNSWDLCYWELKTPHGLLNVGPSAKWSYESWKS